MSRTGKAASDLASDLSRTRGSASPILTIGDRLRTIRSQLSQAEMASILAVSSKTYGLWERAERTPDADAMLTLWLRGWNLNWLISGEGPERLEAAFQSGSQDLSAEALNIALEYADDIIRATRATYVPRSLYATLVRLMYQGITQGLPVADIYKFGQQAVRAAISGTGGQDDDGQSGMDGAAAGGR